jgi:hypothetical protein
MQAVIRDWLQSVRGVDLERRTERAAAFCHEIGALKSIRKQLRKTDGDTVRVEIETD